MNLLPVIRAASPSHRTSRRGTVVRLILMLALAGSLCPASATAKSVTELKSELETVKSQTREAGQAFDRAYWKLDATGGRIAVVNKKLARTRKELTKARSVLGRHVSASYRRGDYALLEFLVSATNFEDLVTRMEYVRRVGAADAGVVHDVKALRSRLASQRGELVAQVRTQRADLASLRSERDKLQSQLRAKQADFARVKRELDRARGFASSNGRVSAPGSNGMVFPVAGSYYYSDTWGAARSGGRRHQGTDIMSPRGTPVVAVVSGTVSSKSGGLGGNTIWLTGSSWSFYYAHLNGWRVRSGRVRAGEVIGYVGSTGNAAGGAPHLHFQMHPHGGSPVNPYPYLRAME